MNRAQRRRAERSSRKGGYQGGSFRGLVPRPKSRGATDNRAAPTEVEETIRKAIREFVRAVFEVDEKTMLMVLQRREGVHPHDLGGLAHDIAKKHGRSEAG